MFKVFSFATSSSEGSKVATTTQALSSQRSIKKKKEKIRQKKDITNEEEVKSVERTEERKRQSIRACVEKPPQSPALINRSGYSSPSSHSSYDQEKKKRVSKYVESRDFLGAFPFEKSEDSDEDRIMRSKKKTPHDIRDVKGIKK